MTSEIVALVGVLTLLGACGQSADEIGNGDDPLESLAAPVPSQRYTVSYWTEISMDDPQLWSAAQAFCNGKYDDAHPNCRVVRQVRGLEHMSTPPALEADRSLRLTPPEQ
jgi:hypothetical protein